MKTSLKTIVVFFAIMALLLTNAKATHYAGGDIEYKCIGVRKWEVQLVLYRNCDNGAASICASMACNLQMTAQPTPQISGGGLNPNGCSGPSLSFNLNLVKVDDVGKSNIARCGSQSKNACDNLGQATPGQYRPSIERYTFVGTLDMSSPVYAGVCPYYDIFYSNCCRNNTFNVNSSAGFVFQSTINIHDRSGAERKNNSPQFLNEAVAVFCASQEYTFNMGATDPDRDSLTYEIIKALEGLNTPVQYNAPWNEFTPFYLNQNFPPHNKFPQAAGIILDTINGDLSLNAKEFGTQPTAGDFTIRIYQWSYKEDPVTHVRTPFIVGITMRNLQIYSTPCLGNNVPRFETNPALLNGKPKYNYSVCAGEKICFTVTAKDTDWKPSSTPPRIDTTYLSWNGAIQRHDSILSFTPDYDINSIPPQRPREDRYKFCWQTSAADASSTPYYFTVHGEDNFCPNPGRVIKAFSITVVDSSTFNIQGPINSLVSATSYTYSVPIAVNVTVNWTITNGAIISGNGTPTVVVKWSAPGQGSLSATSVNGCIHANKLNVTIGSTGMNELNGKLSYVIKPNPNSGNFMIELPEINEVVDVSLFNILGELVYSNTNVKTGNKEILVAVDLKPGIYMLHVKAGDKNAAQKVVISR